jgi:hypothetical protein
MRAGRFPINYRSFSPDVFGFRADLCEKSHQEASMLFVPHVRLHPRCTRFSHLSLPGSRLEIAESLSLDAIAESGLICPVGVNRCLSAFRLKVSRVLPSVFWPSKMRSTIGRSFPHGPQIEQDDMTNVRRHPNFSAMKFASVFLEM